MKANDLVKYCLLKYPSLYDCRFKVLESLFGFYSMGLTLKQDYPDCTEENVAKLTMDYSDLDERIAKREEELEKDGVHLYELNLAHLFQYKFERMKREFIEKNIDIVASSMSATPYRGDWAIHRSFDISDTDVERLGLFKILDVKDLTPDWGDAAQDFAKFWIQRLMEKNQAFSHKDRSYKFPKCVEDLACEWMAPDFTILLKLKKFIDDVDIKLNRKPYSQVMAGIKGDIKKKLDLVNKPVTVES